MSMTELKISYNGFTTNFPILVSFNKLIFSFYFYFFSRDRPFICTISASFLENLDIYLFKITERKINKNKSYRRFHTIQHSQNTFHIKDSGYGEIFSFPRSFNCECKTLLNIFSVFDFLIGA